MSEFLNHHAENAGNLYEYCSLLIAGENGRALYDHYQPWIEQVDAEEAMAVLDRLLTSDIPFDQVKANVGKIMNVFYKSLNRVEPEIPGPGHFICWLMEENRHAEKIMQELKEVLKSLQPAEPSGLPGIFAEISRLVNELKSYELHYIKKENILFPHIENRFPAYRCLQLMWSFHDDFRRCVKSLELILSAGTPDITMLSREMGKLFFVVLPIIFREEKVVFPVALRYIPEEDWNDMMHQSFETGWCYVEPPRGQEESKSGSDLTSEGLVDLGTGLLTPFQMELMMENLPVDITFIDEHDEVRYFSGAKHRIFPRSKSIIGRKVQNCHPPSSVHIVNDIVEAFRSGEKDVAEFWIQMRGRFIHIRYFAMRDGQGSYRGTIEVSQDVTGIRDLTGEQRLLQWK
jgi:hypothetical protein